MPLTPPEPIRADHDVSSFDCGSAALNRWLRDRALANESRFSRTYVITEGAHVAGFHCISAGAVDRGAAPGGLRRNAPDVIPVAVIGRLAVDRAHAGRGLGADLLADALRRIAGAADSIGIRAVLVQAKDEAARAFYLACAEWSEYPDGSRTLFLPVEEIRRAWERPQVAPAPRNALGAR